MQVRYQLRHSPDVPQSYRVNRGALTGTHDRCNEVRDQLTGTGGLLYRTIDRHISSLDPSPQVT